MDKYVKLKTKNTSEDFDVFYLLLNKWTRYFVAGLSEPVRSTKSNEFCNFQRPIEECFM